jgi:glycosyltransferase involved in cell wall biosynthesis
LIICVGRLSAAKGHRDLLAAFADLLEVHPSVSLAIVGDGMMRAELEEEIQRRGLEKRARLLGAREDVRRLLAASDIFVTASRIEGLPLAVLEAMAAGLPVVATIVGDIPNLVSKRMGLLVPPGQPSRLRGALDALIRDPQAAKRMGEEGRKHVADEYSVDNWVEKLRFLYSEIVQAGDVIAPPAEEGQ